MFRLLFELNRRMPNGTYGGVRGIINLYSINGIHGSLKGRSPQPNIVTERRSLRENKEARIFLFRMKRKNG